MKPKLLLTISALTLLFLILLAKVGPRAETPAAVPRGGQPSDEISTRATAEANGGSFPTASSAGSGANGAGPETGRPNQDLHQVPNQPDQCARCDELLELSMSSDPASLDEILRELRNPDSTIRAAALAAAIQFGSRDAIPTLAQAAMETEDGNEKTNILEAIEFLKLPSLSEVLTQTPPAAPVLPTGMSSKP